MVVGLGAIGLLAIYSSPVSAQDAVAYLPQDIADNLWIIIAAFMVFLMQPGFAFLEAGMTRAKNVANIMAKNLADMVIGSLAFFIVGYGIAYGTDAGSLIGSDGFFLSGVDGSVSGGLSSYADFFFQVVFAATAVTISSGAMAERTKFSGYLLFCVAMTAFIYPMVVHSLWSGSGILADLNIDGVGFIDFAGSSIVHSTGGWAAMMGAIFLGPRIGRYDSTGGGAIPGHNIAFTTIGVFILWFGWFGFNGGSELAISAAVTHIVLTTMLSASAGGLMAGIIIWLRTGSVDVAMVGNGILAGLVGVTAGTAVVNPAGALAIGAISGIIVVYSVFFFDRLKVDDPVGAISVHGVCGAWGTIAVGLFATVGDTSGLLYGGGGSLLLVQAIGVGIVFLWVTITSGFVFVVLEKFNLLRVSREEELQGLDIHEHGSQGYGFDLESNVAPPVIESGTARVGKVIRRIFQPND